MIPPNPAMRSIMRITTPSPIRRPAASEATVVDAALRTWWALLRAVEGVERAQQGADFGVGDGVEDPLAFAACGHEALGTEDSQLLGEGRLADIERGFELADTALAVGHLAEQEQAVLVGEGAQKGGYGPGGDAHRAEVKWWVLHVIPSGF